MSYRLKIGRCVNKFGNFLKKIASFICSLTVVIMKPNDLVEFTRQNYNMKEVQEKWGDEDYLINGLYPSELNLLEKIPFKKGRLLLICLGAGREAIPLARMGFEVVGVDFVPTMVSRAMEYADRQGVRIEALVQGITNLNLPRDSFDLVWCTNEIYSFIPTSKKRLDLLSTISDTLKPEGYFLCSFRLNAKAKPNPHAESMRKFLAWATLNSWYETGDNFSRYEFIHTFFSIDEIAKEFFCGGFDILYFDKSGGAVLRKRGIKFELYQRQSGQEEVYRG